MHIGGASSKRVRRGLDPFGSGQEVAMSKVARRVRPPANRCRRWPGPRVPARYGDVVVTPTARLEELVRDIADFPAPGVVFKDITPLLANAPAFASAVEALAQPFAGQGIEQVVGIEARGFILAAPIAHRLGAGFVPVRKGGKLPGAVERERYELEYGSDVLEVHADALVPGARVLVVDDVLATGGTAAATVRLVEKLDGHVVGMAFVLELAFLSGRDQLAGRHVVSLLTYAARGDDHR
jgi:adenine phosphoribosyltransferase